MSFGFSRTTGNASDTSNDRVLFRPTPFQDARQSLRVRKISVFQNHRTLVQLLFNPSPLNKQQHEMHVDVCDVAVHVDVCAVVVLVVVVVIVVMVSAVVVLCVFCDCYVSIFYVSIVTCPM